MRYTVEQVNFTETLSDELEIIAIFAGTICNFAKMKIKSLPLKGHWTSITSSPQLFPQQAGVIIPLEELP